MHDASPEILTGLSPEHLAELRAARDTLENPSFAMQAASLLGTPIEKGLAILPDGWRRTVKNAVQGALEKAAHFALGSDSKSDDAADSGYWAARAALGKAVSDAASWAATGSAGAASAPAMVRLVESIAARFGVTVSEQIAAKAVPVAGAVAGAAVNLMFMGHYQRVASAHFTVRRLERLYGADLLQKAWHRLD